MGQDHGQLWDELVRLVRERDADGIARFFEDLPPGDVARVLARLEEADQASALSQLQPSSAAGVMERVPDRQAAALMGRLDAPDAAAILQELPSNHQADLLTEIQPGHAEAILAEMPAADAEAARTLSHYPSTVAGGLMITEFLAYNEDGTVGDVVDDLRANAERYGRYDVQYAYVTGAGGKLLGVLRLRELLLSPPQTPLRAIAMPDPLFVRDDAPLSELRELFDVHSYFGVPVVDESGRLLGVLRRSTVKEALAHENTGAYLKSQGIVGGEELRNMPLLVRCRRRLSWLTVNILLNIVAASVIALYQDTLTAVIALAVFLPIISDMSGCSGNQAVAVSIRELTLGILRPGDLLRVWLKEIAVGVLNGAVLGILIGAGAIVWKGNVYLGLVVGLAMAINTMVAVTIGGLVPLVLRRLDFDPALASGPILTTVTDLCGFLLILGLATQALPYLT